jgi:hypothetical protein
MIHTFDWIAWLIQKICKALLENHKQGTQKFKWWEVGAWRKLLQSLLSEYHQQNIFNTDQCELYFSLLSGKTYAYKD